MGPGATGATGASSASRASGATTPAQINFGWLIRLRWATIAGQAVTITAVRFGMGLDIPIAPLFGLCALAAAVNLGCIAWSRAATAREWWLLAVMAFDVVTFSALLYFTGGPENPFSFLYLVPIALAAITLPPAATWALVMLSLGSSAVLFARHRPLPLGGDHAHHMTAHLQGMWVAFGVAAAFIVHFLLRVRRALARRDDELAASRNLAARQERLASLATLAAGAAHELATPLSTIAVVAKDLERDVAAAGAPATATEDVQLMRREVERCRRILERMRVDAGDSTGERFVRVRVAELVSDCVDQAESRAGKPPVEITIEEAAAGLVTLVPRRAFAQALRGLVDNAQDASPAGTPVSLRVAGGAAGPLRFEVADRGAGIAADVLARVGEPFFTTKPTGKGMGLGVFLARAVIERLGGQFTIRSVPGGGTTATLSLPLAEAP
jgi:two-component system sensor histidine kinase RegB